MQDMLPVDSALHSVESYGEGGFTIRGELYEHAVLLSANAVAPWQADDPVGWTGDMFAPIFLMDEPPEVLLLGTGKQHEFVSPGLKKALKVKGVSVDSMDTGAACRTYNLLLAEGRRVAAVLLLPK